MRRALPLAVLAFLVAVGEASAATLTLRIDRPTAAYGSTVHFSGELSPVQAGTPIAVYVSGNTGWRLVATGSTQADGRYRLATIARTPSAYVAVAQVDPATQVPSGEAALRIRPRLVARVEGRRVVGERLRVSGRLLPAAAGRLRLTGGGRGRILTMPASGRFRAPVPSDRPGRLRFSLTLVPAPGYEGVRRSHAVLLRAPDLSLGSRGGAVRVLERRLFDLRYALRTVDGSYGHDTVEAVLAFQKVHGMARTGRVGSAFWRALARASVPRAYVPRGDHVEISKTRQVMFEVRGGEVVKAVHVSTGATGNTPVGRWRVYRLGPGWNALRMYYSLYFLRGFAIHGYPSVPTYPASHGCVRTPVWFAPGFYSRWGRVGTAVYVFP